MGHGRGRRVVALGAGVATLCAVTWFTVRAVPGDSLADVATLARPIAPTPPDDRGIARPAAAVAADTTAALPAGTSAPLDTEQETVAGYASEKYELLLEQLEHLPAEEFAALNLALLRRELLTGNSGLREELGQADAAVRAMLRPSEQALFDALKDSDLELFQLNEYAGGISNVAPLSADDRKSILRTKLVYKERFQQLVADSGLARDGLSATEREYALGVVERAMTDYQRSYLQEVRQYLSNDEQFALLSNFENTEFATELDKLRAKTKGG
jgi:hypothetical protein